MTKTDLHSLIVECMQEYFANAQPLQENTMTLKKSELKALVNEVVRQCVKEAGPQYKVRTNKSQVEQPGKVNRARQIQSDPKVNEVAPPGGEDVVKALKKKSSVDNPWAVAWSMKNKGQLENEMPEVPDMGGDEHGGEGYDEQEEIELLKQLGQIVLKLLQMHRGMEEPEGEVGGETEDDGVPFKGVPDTGEGEETETELEPETSETPEEDDELKENHKVQARSHKTVKDLPNDPKNVRDPEVPQG